MNVSSLSPVKGFERKDATVIDTENINARSIIFVDTLGTLRADTIGIILKKIHSIPIAIRPSHKKNFVVSFNTPEDCGKAREYFRNPDTWKHENAEFKVVLEPSFLGPSKTIYVQNIDKSWTDEQLQRHCNGFGECFLPRIFRTRSTAYTVSTGMARITFRDEEIAEKLVQMTRSGQLIQHTHLLFFARKTDRLAASRYPSLEAIPPRTKKPSPNKNYSEVPKTKKKTPESLKISTPTR